MGRYLRTKRNFLWFSTIAVGSGFALILLWNFGPYSEPLMRLFLVTEGFGAGWLWGFAMWHFWAAPYFNLDNDKSNR